MSTTQLLALSAPTIVLLAGLVDDLRTQKVHNWLVLSLLGMSIIFVFAFSGLGGLKEGLLGFACALGVGVPLVLAGILGGGDMKLLAVFGMTTNWGAVLGVLAFSLVWGTLLGIFRAILQGQAKQLFSNVFKLVSRQKSEEKMELHKIPYTVALFFGWMTYLSMTGFGGHT